MKDYTSENPVFSDNIRIVERTDPANPENANAAAKQLLQNTMHLHNQLNELNESLRESETFTTVDKQKLSGIEEGANKTVVDDNLSDTSDNPVKNKAVKAALDAKGAPVLIQEAAPDDKTALWVW